MKNKSFWIKTVVFSLLLLLLIAGISYVFRLKSDDAETSIVGFYREPKDTLDGVYIGASNVYWYWQAPLAYHDNGLAVMDYAVGSLPYAAFSGVVKECLKTQSPKVLLIDPRSFAGDNTPDAFGVHNLFDYMPFSVNKLQTLNRVCDSAGVSGKTRLEYYVPFVRFHYIWEELDRGCFTRDASTVKNAVVNEDVFTFVTEYRGEMQYTDLREPIDERKLAALTELLDTCDQLDCRVIFVASPFLDDLERKRELNSIGDLLESRGYAFWNFNDPALYETLDLEIPGDFYDAAHVNIHGSIKYTKVLSDMLAQAYSLPDRRGAVGYESWEEAYARYRNLIWERTGVATGD